MPTIPLSPLAAFLRTRFQGVFVTMTLAGGGVVFGEVYDGFDNFLALKYFGVTTYVNVALITSINGTGAGIGIC